MASGNYRHEWKFVVCDAQLALIRSRIAPLMKADAHQSGDAYVVTSLYFDDANDSCYAENLDGSDRRSKYRIRIYNHNTDFIKLERKSKLRGMTRKESERLSLDECRQLMQGSIPHFRSDLSSEKTGLLCDMRLLGLLPKSIVEYERTAFTERIGNVRITFDRNIRGVQKPAAFLRERIDAFPLLPVDAHILEVKYDALMPTYLMDILEIETLQRTAFSKYCYSRAI